MPYYVTTPIYYVNAEPHLGHAYTTIAADVLAPSHAPARRGRLLPHGHRRARRAGGPGRRARWASRRASWPTATRCASASSRVAINATNDFFIRTTDPEHEATVQEVVQRIHDNGHVYEGTYEGWYCPRCADFKTEAELVDGNKCPIHLIELEREKEDNWFFRLSAFQEPLEQLYAERPDFVTPRGPLQRGALVHQAAASTTSRSSRARLTWGVPVPWDESQVIYVWIDALLNYYTALRYARPGEDLTDRYWPATVHLIGKDILKFHAVIWPAHADGRRASRCRRAGLHPRLPADGRAQDVEVARQRDRPVRGDGPSSTAPTRCATTCSARCASARTARSRPRASRRVTTPSSPTSTATWPAARWR